jgi:hypothetical protein
MANSATPPVSETGRSEPVTHSPVPAGGLTPELQALVPATKPPVVAPPLSFATQVETAPSTGAGHAEVRAAAASSSSPLPSAEKGSGPATEPTMTSERSLDGPTVSLTSSGAGEPTKTEPIGKRAKAEPETLEQFIEYAYARKGQPLTLKSKVEKRIAVKARLDEAALSRLLQLAKGDTLLAVPLQILLLSREVTGFPALKTALAAFVSNVMLRHPLFGDTGVQGALRNLPEGLRPADALARVAAYEPPPSPDAGPLKGSDLRDLRHNAARLFVTWLAVNRGLNIDELSLLLFQVIWHPAAKDLTDDNMRLRALTDIGLSPGVGLALQRFRQQAIDAQIQQHQALREVTSLRNRVTAAENQLLGAETNLETIRRELQVLQESYSGNIEKIRSQSAVEITHLKHELDQLRGRLLKRLTDSVEMLENGLTALRKENPRVPVMMERAEHVLDSLKAEARYLCGE